MNYAACSFFRRFRWRDIPRSHRSATAKKGNRKNRRSHFPKPVGVILRGCINGLGQASALRLNTDLDLEILGNGASRYRVHKDKKCSRAHIGMRPERNDAGANSAVLNDGERRSVVCVGRCRRHQPEYRQKPDRKCSLEMAFQRHAHGNSTDSESRYPLISVARISMGWNISHTDATQRTSPTVAQGMNARIGLWGESSSARP